MKICILKEHKHYLENTCFHVEIHEYGLHCRAKLAHAHISNYTKQALNKIAYQFCTMHQARKRTSEVMGLIFHCLVIT